jgi:hypothetical protein
MRNELEMIQKKQLCLFHVLYWHFLGATEQNHKNLKQDSQVSRPTAEPTEYKARVLTIIHNIWHFNIILYVILQWNLKQETQNVANKIIFIIFSP